MYKNFSEITRAMQETYPEFEDKELLAKELGISMGHLNNCHRNNTPPAIPLVLWCHKENFTINSLLFRPRL